MSQFVDAAIVYNFHIFSLDFEAFILYPRVLEAARVGTGARGVILVWVVQSLQVLLRYGVDAIPVFIRVKGVNLASFLFAEFAELEVSDISSLLLVQIVEHQVNVLRRHLDPHPLDSLVELLPRNSLVVVEVEEQEGLRHHLELLFDLVRDQGQ